MAKNPALFRAMREPFETAELADAALKSFFEGLAELRKKHDLANVYVVVADSCKLPDDPTAEGGEGEFIATMMLGDEQLAESMAAYAFGHEQSQRQHRVAAIMAKATRKAIKKGERES